MMGSFGAGRVCYFIMSCVCILVYTEPENMVAFQEALSPNTRKASHHMECCTVSFPHSPLQFCAVFSVFVVI
jgi:hypothetical protein